MGICIQDIFEKVFGIILRFCHLIIFDGRKDGGVNAWCLRQLYFHIAVPVKH